jgi:hypothetical protein
MNVPIETALAVAVTIPTLAALRAAGQGHVKAAEDRGATRGAEER